MMAKVRAAACWTVMFLAVMAGLAATSTDAQAEPRYRYSWYSYQGPYFDTPAEVCIWARSLFAPGYGEETMALGENGICRTHNGGGYMYIPPYRLPVPYVIELAGQGSTTALPAGPALPLTARVTQDGAPAANVPVTVSTGYAQLDGATDSSGEYRFNFIPAGQGGSEQISATCSYCANTASKSINVQPGQTCEAFGNPVMPATGAKEQTEHDWTDGGAHPLDLVRYYSSQADAGAGPWPRWTHNWSASAINTELQALVRAAGASAAASFSRASPSAPWTASNGLDSLTQNAEGLLYTRAADESRWQFDASGRLASITARNGWRYTLMYNPQGRLNGVTNAFGRTLSFVHDAHGWLVAAVPPGAEGINYSVDGAGRLARVTHPGGQARNYHYEDSRHPHALTGIDDERGVRYASFAYDAAGRAISTWHAGGAESYSIQYGQSAGARGRLSAGGIDPAIYRASAQVTSPQGQVQTYHWIGGNGKVHLQSGSGPLGGQTVASRSIGSVNLPEQDTDFLGYITSYQWEPGRQLLVGKTLAAGRPEAKTVSTQWHGTWRLPVFVTEGGRSIAYTYDASGNKLSETVTDTSTGEARTTAWTYNPQGLADTMTDAKGGIWRYSYDTAGNRTSIKNPLGQETRQGFDAAGRMTGRTDPGGLTTSYSWDVRGRLLSQNAGGEVTSYSYTANGQVAGVALPNGYSASYTYDAAQRLISASDRVTYLHNALGQRVFKSEVQAEQTAPNEEELGGSFIDWLKKNFKWLFLKASSNASVGTSYVYGDGELPNWALLGEYDNGSAAGTGRTEYLWLPTPDGAMPIGLFRNGKLFAIHADHLGTPRLMTNESNTPVWQWPYSAFGNNKPTGILKATAKPRQAMTNQPVMLKATNPQQELNVRMPGQYFDVETGIFENHWRSFDPRTGRYWQADPIGLAGGMNTYVYARNSPFGYADPSGLSPVGWVMKLFKNGQSKSGRPLHDKAEAVAARQAGQDVRMATKQGAREVEVAANGGDDVLRHNGHSLPNGSTGLPHYQTEGATGHTFWGRQQGGVDTSLLGTLGDILIPFLYTPGSLNANEQEELAKKWGPVCR